MLKHLLITLGLLLLALPLGAEEFKTAQKGYQFSFPQDHRAHLGYRTEWWYYTGHLEGAEERFGFEFTIFKIERQEQTLYLFHCALTHPEGFLFDEKIQRAFPGLAGQQGASLVVENNRLSIQGKRHRLQSTCKDMKLSLELSHQRPPVIHGQEGISPKGASAGNASHYYSLVDLKGSAELEFEGQTRQLDAQVWMDHEWGSNFLEKHQMGWDWATLSLDSGLKLMLFRIRQEGSPDFYWGTWIPAEGSERPYREFKLIPQGSWTSPKSGATYPASFRVEAQEGWLELTPWRPNQELRTPVAGMAYFEGAIDVTGQWQGKEVSGLGYLEMTGYAGPMEGKF